MLGILPNFIINFGFCRQALDNVINCLYICKFIISKHKVICIQSTNEHLYPYINKKNLIGVVINNFYNFIANVQCTMYALNIMIVKMYKHMFIIMRYIHGICEE